MVNPCREPEMPPLVGVKQAADYFGVHHRTIRNWLAKGAPHIRVGRVIRIDLLNLHRWASQKPRKPTQVDENFGSVNELKRARVRQGLSTEQVAKLAQMPHFAYLEYEGDEASPLRKNGSWAKSALTVASIVGQLPQALWPRSALNVLEPIPAADTYEQIAPLVGLCYALPPTAQDENLMWEEIADKLNNCSKVLSKKQRIIIYDYVIDGQDFDEIAACLGMSTFFVKHTYLNAMTELKQALEKAGIRRCPV